jgi:hypothetical protein
MQPDDPFPIERCSPRLRTAILAEFNGRCPTYQELSEIPRQRWMKVPGIGKTFLNELESMIHTQDAQPKQDTSSRLTDDELIALLESLQRRLRKLRTDIQSLMRKPRSQQDDSDGSDLP